MAKGNRTKGPRGTWSRSDVEKARAALLKLAATPAPQVEIFSRSAVVVELVAAIAQARVSGYEDRAISKLLDDLGIHVGVATLRRQKQAQCELGEKGAVETTRAIEGATDGIATLGEEAKAAGTMGRFVPRPDSLEL